MRLTDLEIRILTALAGGLQSKEISALVGRSTPTIETHIRILFARFNARSRAQLVAYAVARGIIEVSERESGLGA